jgi:hypothetical protein
MSKEGVPKTMSTCLASINRQNAQHSSGLGPCASTAKSASSRNPLARDYVLSGEKAEYEATRAQLWQEVDPSGFLEETLVRSLLTATWRLRRCSLVEGRMADSLDPGLDPMEDERACRLQNSIDRARLAAHRLLRESLTELRRLQTERTARDQISTSGPKRPYARLAGCGEVLTVISRADRILRSQPSVRHSIQSASRSEADIRRTQLASFCERVLARPETTLDPAA